MVQKGTIRNTITVQWKNEWVSERASATHIHHTANILYYTWNYQRKGRRSRSRLRHAHSTMCIAHTHMKSSSLQRASVCVHGFEMLIFSKQLRTHKLIIRSWIIITMIEVIALNDGPQPHRGIWHKSLCSIPITYTHGGDLNWPMLPSFMLCVHGRYVCVLIESKLGSACALCIVSKISYFTWRRDVIRTEKMKGKAGRHGKKPLSENLQFNVKNLLFLFLLHAVFLFLFLSFLCCFFGSMFLSMGFSQSNFFLLQLLLLLPLHGKLSILVLCEKFFLLPFPLQQKKSI